MYYVNPIKSGYEILSLKCLTISQVAVVQISSPVASNRTSAKRQKNSICLERQTCEVMKWIKTILLSLLGGQLFATAQIPDILIYEGDSLFIYANPLETYFDQTGSRELPKFKGCSSTACWRGYLGIWELRNDSIFLKEITTCSKRKCDTVVNADLAELFGGKYVKGEVFADWISFELLSPHGKQLKYIHQGYESVYEYERGFEFIAGKLIRLNEYDNTRSRESVYAKESNVLLKFLFDNLDWEMIEAQSLMGKERAIATFQVGENEKLVGVKVVRGINPRLDEEAERVLNLIPDWTVYYRRGRIVETQWTLPISFDKGFYESELDK